MTRRLRVTQYIPDGPPAAFTVIGPATSPVGWHIKVRDAIHGDEPEFLVPRTTGPKKAPTLVTLDEVCRVGFREANGGKAVLTLTEWVNGYPVFTARVACWPGWSASRPVKGTAVAVPIFKVLWSTDPERAARELPWHEPPPQFIGPTLK